MSHEQAASISAEGLTCHQEVIVMNAVCQAASYLHPQHRVQDLPPPQLQPRGIAFKETVWQRVG